MLVSFPRDDATEKRLDFQHVTSEREWHEGICGSGEDSWEYSGEKGVLWRHLSRMLSGREDSWEYSGENAALSKCHCSDGEDLLAIPGEPASRPRTRVRA